ncbi:MAG: DEAD/DEAH box helicase [Bacteroidota bacterium]|nr:DEAD/DEAH box helicase [Bacteroidota bacterium]
MTFNELNLNKPLLQALTDLEFEYPTPIQEKAFSPIMSGRDVVGVAQTGTGKTFAYLLPILRQLSFSKQRDARVLILVPTRELVVQVTGEIAKLCKYCSFRVGAVYGGTNIKTQKQLIYDGLDIIVASPGRLLDLYLSGILRFKTIQKIVIDEVDEMLKLGFRAQITSILEKITSKHQNLMFSATLTPDVQMFIDEYFLNPFKIVIAPHGTPLEKIVQQAYQVPNFNTKVNLLEYLLKSDNDLNKVLVFVSTKKLADRLYEQMVIKFPDQIGVIHSNKTQNFRFNTLKQFTDGSIRVLVATDVIARGMDIQDVSHVINFDTPEVAADYIHRIGRTGRVDKEGVAITFVNEIEQEYQMAIEQLMNKPITILSLPKDVAISSEYTEEEQPAKLFDIDYLKAVSFKPKINSAFQEKKEKNKKVNSGGMRRKLKNESKHKNTKPTKPRF